MYLCFVVVLSGVTGEGVPYVITKVGSFVKLVFLSLGFIVLLSFKTFAAEPPNAEQVLEEINLARTNPAAYAGFLRQFRSYFKGRVYQQPGSDIRIQTQEGRKAVDEAITFLARQKPLKPLTWSNGLAVAAGSLVNEQGSTGATGHRDSHGNGPRERVEYQGKWERNLAENIGYGPTEAREMVVQLIVDDGVSDRGHRRNIFTAGFGTAGIACGPHPRFGSMCVIDFTGGFRD